MNLTHPPLLVFLFSLISIQAPAYAQAMHDMEKEDVIVITGTQIPVTKEKVGNALTIIKGEDIVHNAYASIADVLQQVPGIAISKTGGPGGLTQVRLRGSESNHILVLIDGVELSTAKDGEVDFSTLLTNDIDRIEIIRGPQSGLYGSNALAGVINIITRTGQNPGATLTTETGAFGSLYGQIYGAAGSDKGFISGSFAHRQSDGYNASRLGTEKDGNRVSSFYVRAGTQLLPSFNVAAMVRGSNKKSDADGFDFSGGPDQGLPIDEDAFNATDDFSYALTGLLDPHEGRWVTNFSFSHLKTSSEGGNGAIASFGSEDNRKTAFVKSTLLLTPKGSKSGRHALTLFAEDERESYKNTFPTDSSQIPTLSRESQSIGIEYRGEIASRFFFNFAARQDYNDAFADASTFSSNMAWVVPEQALRLHASYGTGVTNPTFFEQFGFVPGQFVGNPNLKPEEAFGYDLGIEKSLWNNKALLDVTWFRSDLENEIRAVFPSVINDTGTSKRRGVEVSLDAQLHDALSLSASYTHLRASDFDGTPEVRRPEHQATVNLSGPLLQGRGSWTFGLFYNGQFVDTDFRNYFSNNFMAEKTALDAYLLARASASYALTPRVEIYGRVENLFDEDYQQIIGYNTQGQSAFLGLRTTLGPTHDR